MEINMSFDNLRDFTSELEKNQELIHINSPISPILEITEITDRISKGHHEKNKAIFFKNITGYNVPVLINIFGLPHLHYSV